jgi:hypothetical protein
VPREGHRFFSSLPEFDHLATVGNKNQVLGRLEYPPYPAEEAVTKRVDRRRRSWRPSRRTWWPGNRPWLLGPYLFFEVALEHSSGAPPTLMAQ